MFSLDVKHLHSLLSMITAPKDLRIQRATKLNYRTKKSFFRAVFFRAEVMGLGLRSENLREKLSAEILGWDLRLCFCTPYSQHKIFACESGDRNLDLKKIIHTLQSVK